VVVTNAQSISISGGSVAILAGANVIGSASVVQSTPNSLANAWPTRITDTVDSAAVDSSSRLFVAITDGTNIYGMAGSPIATAVQMNSLYWNGSLLTSSTLNLSSSAAGCVRIVASTAGQSIVVFAATYVTSSCQSVGWVASGAGEASALVQSAMDFGTQGGMDANRAPYSYLWQFPSGSNAVLTTTSACYVRGTISYIKVAS